jgi:hypothetical protein
MSVIQGVRGVAWVDIDAFGSIPEKAVAADGTRTLVTQAQVTAAVADALNKGTQVRRRGGLAANLPPDVIAFPGGNDRGVLRPAELAIFTPAVADTLILNPLS